MLLSAGKVNVRPPDQDLKNTEAQHPEVRAGGQWAPSDCYARQRLAIIIPFRGRHHHLNKLLQIIHPFLQRQQANYTIFIIEQVI